MIAVASLAVIYFVVLVVLALEPREPVRRGRHRRDPAEEAR